MGNADVADDSIFRLKYADTVSSLSRAGLAGDLEKIKALLKKGCLPQTPDNIGWCAIHSCVASNQLDALKLMLNFKKKNRKFLSNLCTWEGESPLIVAAKSNVVSFEIVKTLLECGADPKLTTNLGMTALHYVCKTKDNINVVKLLVNHGAFVDAKEHLNGYTPLHFAIVEGVDQEVVRYLTEHGDINLPDCDSETPLYKACVCNFLEAVECILLKDTTSVNMMPRSNFSPLSAAALNGNLKMVKLLLEAGADTQITGPAGFHRHSLMEKTFLPIHSSVRNVDVFKLLLMNMDPYNMLKYERTTYSASLPIFTMMYAPGSECFEALLQFSFPPGFDSLKIVNCKKLTDFILHTHDYLPNEMLEKFQLFFKYCSNFEPETFFKHFASLIPNFRHDLLEKFDILCLLTKMGISSGGAFESKLKIVRLLGDISKTSNKEEMISETILALQQPVLTLKQLSRVASRRFIRSVTESDWSAYIMIRDSNLPSSLKKYLWFQILC